MNKNIEEWAPDDTTLAERLRIMADGLDADPDAVLTWKLWDGETLPAAYPHERDGEPGVVIQMSRRHFVWMPYEIAMRMHCTMGWSIVEAGAAAVRKEESDEAP